MGNTISCEFHLHNQDDSITKRRMKIKRDELKSFNDLKQKLVAVFKKLEEAQTEYSVTWRKSRTEKIKIKNDEDLERALSQMHSATCCTVQKWDVQFINDSKGADQRFSASGLPVDGEPATQGESK